MQLLAKGTSPAWPHLKQSQLWQEASSAFSALQKLLDVEIS
jgi:hypothetical protein